MWIEYIIRDDAARAGQHKESGNGWLGLVLSALRFGFVCVSGNVLLDFLNVMLYSPPRLGEITFADYLKYGYLQRRERKRGKRYIQGRL